MNLHLVEHLDEPGVAVVHDLAVADVQPGDLHHVLIAEGKVPDGNVLLHALSVDGLGDDGDAPLDVPTQSHLGGALAVLLTDPGQHGMRKDAVVALGEGAPCLGVDAVRLHERQGVLLLEEGVELHLVDGGPDLHRLADVGQDLRIAVAHADGPELAGLVCLLHGPVGADIVAHGLVDQVQVDVVQSQLLHRRLNGPFGALVAGVLHPQLRGDEQFLTGYAAFGDGTAHGLLVHVGCSGVDEAVSRGDGVQNRLLADGRVRHLEHAEALQGHLNSVVQFDRFDLAHGKIPPVRIHPF